MPGAWDDERPRAEDGYDAPLGADSVEELEHELALAAALDRSRPSLSPDARSSDRMRRRLFEAMAEEGFGRMEQGHAATRRPAPVPGPSELTAPIGAPVPAADLSGPATRPVGPPVQDAPPEVPAASVGRAAGEHTLSAGSEPRTRRRPRHVLPSDHPDNPDQGERDRSRPSGSRPSGRRRPGLRRRFGVVVAAVAAVAVLAGLAATMSRDALPGDALYGVKRVTESTGGVFTFGDQAEATRQLGLAKTRMDEVQGLMERGDSPDSAAITSSMDDFDTATSNGSRMMLSADRGGNGSELADLRTWATAQQSRMNDMRSTMPSANASDAEESMALLDRVLVRTEALRAETGCVDGGTASVDDLGPLPSGEPCTSTGTAPSAESDGTVDGTTPDSPESNSTTPDSGTSTSGTPSGVPGENGTGVPPLLGDPSRSPTGTTSSSGTSSTSPTSTTDEPGSLLPPITLPPLLPGLGPVTIG